MKKEEISIKNTKSEILDALNEALKREKILSSSKSNPEQLALDLKSEQVVKSTRESVKDNIFSSELIDKFNNLEEAIKIEEEKLKTLYGVEKELNNLTIIVNAGKDYMVSLENTKKSETQRINDLISTLEVEYKNKADELKKEYDETAKVLKTQRERETEEYNYNTKREREIDNNKWADEKKKKDEELKDIELKTKALLEETKAKEEHIKQLETSVESIPSLLDKEYEKGKKDATNELTKEHKYEVELLKKDYQNTIDRQLDKIASLESELNKSMALSSLLQEKLDKAYVQVKELATKTVETSGSVKILNSQIEKKYNE